MNVYEQRRPQTQNWERLTSEALMAAATPGVVLQATVRPPLPQIDPWRPRFGYLPYEARQANVEDVLQVARLYGDARDDISGGPGGYQASSRSVSSNGSW